MSNIVGLFLFMGILSLRLRQLGLPVPNKRASLVLWIVHLESSKHSFSRQSKQEHVKDRGLFSAHGNSLTASHSS